MNVQINAKQLRASLPKLVERVRRGARFTVFYRSRPAFQIIPVDEQVSAQPVSRRQGARGVLPALRQELLVYRLHELVVMRELKLRQALTTDSHFRRIGFQVLP